MRKQTIRDIDVAGKRVLLRVDYNVQVDEAGVRDDYRLRESLPTINALREAGARIAIISHRGRPQGRPEPAFSNAPVAAHLGSLLGTSVACATECVGPEAEAAVNALKPGEVVVLENVRFHAEEEKNDPAFAAALAQLGDIYVDDAFGTAHRAHASIVGIPAHLPAVAGLLMEREVHYLGSVADSPERPFALVLGGAKMSDKLLILEHLLDRTDVICVGGAMANTFLMAQGIRVEDSLVERDRVDTAREILDRVSRRPGFNLVLPTDVVAAFGAGASSQVVTVPVDRVPSGWRILDIGPATVEAFSEALRPVKTAVWNGPMGLFEQARFALGSLAMARVFALLNATTIVGGGETAAVVAQAGVAAHITHISTGGGASLEMLEGKTLPGVAALLDAK
ncbi:MAG: phosphoglycerate kinase [Dehalococcoidia bacterium]|nr:phosphoglycerate kinase [Dehalococcoidia bacterium]